MVGLESFVKQRIKVRVRGRVRVRARGDVRIRARIHSYSYSIRRLPQGHIQRQSRPIQDAYLRVRVTVRLKARLIRRPES